MAGAWLLAPTIRAQLAITEMMSSTWKILGLTSVTNSDFWELTNFGTNTINLTGYKFSDNKNSPQPLAKSNNPLWIHPGESVVFVRNNYTTNEVQFRNWWGPCIGSDLQVRFYTRPGFASTGDGIRVYDPSLNLVDTIDFGPATFGVSFVYNPDSGAFGDLSIPGLRGACQANSAVDTASPGVTIGPIPLRITQQPTSVLACAAADATFRLVAVGMPRPRYQWFFNNAPIAGENQASLTVPAASVGHAGVYSVRVSNGISTLQSSDATLSINTKPSAPVILSSPVEATVVTNRTARFSITACAFPVATYQWFSNGVAIPDATNRTLFIPNCRLDMSGQEYCARAANALGTNSACARLYVTPRPDLRITEVQAYPFTALSSADCNAHHDWFEVTNFGTNAVNLLGYRLSDTFSPAGAFVVTQSLVMQPNQSVVFVKNPTTDPFVQWWGAQQLPPDLPLIPYAGFSLGKLGDALYLWSVAAEVADEAIDSISFAGSTEGVSIQFGTLSCEFGCASAPGEGGAFRSLQCGDIGSPGYTANPPPRVVSLALEGDGAHVRWRGVEGATYQLEYNATPQTKGWSPLGRTTATNALPTLTDPGASQASRRFYRVGRLTP